MAVCVAGAVLLKATLFVQLNNMGCRTQHGVCVCAAGSRDDRTPLVDVGAIMDQHCMLCSIIMEAALHALPERSTSDAEAASCACHAAGIVADFAIEATMRAAGESSASASPPAAAAALPAGAAASKQATGASNALVQQVFCQLVAGLKHIHIPVPAAWYQTGEVLNLFQNKCALFCSTSSAALRILGDVPAAACASTTSQPKQWHPQCS